MKIVDVFIKINDFTNHKKILFLNKLKFYSIVRFLNRNVAYFILRFFYFLTSRNKQYSLGGGRSCNVIVSLTSFPARLEDLNLTLETILRQDLQPNRILVYLSSDQISSLNLLPLRLSKLTKRGVEYIFVEGDIKSHKKYYYSLKDFPNNPILTIDDDLLYDSKMLNRLYSAYLKDPSIIYCHYGYTITYNPLNKIESYRDWVMNKSFADAGLFNFFGSGGGTLFPPGTLHPEVFNIEVVKEICFNADDVWLNAMSRLVKTKVCQLRPSSILFIPNSNLVSLKTINLAQNQNDVQIKNVSEYCLEKFGVDPFSYDYLLEV